jgi:hypothetical protein
MLAKDAHKFCSLKAMKYVAHRTKIVVASIKAKSALLCLRLNLLNLLNRRIGDFKGYT